MIRTEGLTKYYGSFLAVKDLSLEVAEGEIFGFIGPNGAGKTTTMRVLATLLLPSRGAASVDGADVVREPERVRRLVGYMPDFMGVYDDLHVVEYLEFFAAAFRVPRKKRRGVIDGVLELTDLTGRRHARVSALSRGMQQRLQLARVLIHDPKALILDEPASGLDPRARIEIRELLKELRAMGKTIMISSHILSELEEMCDRVAIIEQGRLVFSGTIDAIREKLGVNRKVRIRVDGDLSRAADVLGSLPQVEGVETTATHLVVRLGDGRTGQAELVRQLVNAGEDVLEITAEQVRLDDAFLKLTRGAVS